MAEPVVHLKSVVIRRGGKIPFHDMWKDTRGAPLWMQVSLEPHDRLRVMYLSPFGDGDG